MSVPQAKQAFVASVAFATTERAVAQRVADLRAVGQRVVAAQRVVVHAVVRLVVDRPAPAHGRRLRWRARILVRRQCYIVPEKNQLVLETTTSILRFSFNWQGYSK